MCKSKSTKYKTLLNVLFKITPMWTHEMVISKIGPLQDGIIISFTNKYLKTQYFSFKIYVPFKQ